MRGLVGFFAAAISVAGATSAHAEAVIDVDPANWQFVHVRNPEFIGNHDIYAWGLTHGVCEHMLLGTVGHGLFVSERVNRDKPECWLLSASAPLVKDSQGIRVEQPPNSDGIEPSVGFSWRQVFPGKSVRQIATAPGVIIVAVSEGTSYRGQVIYRSLDGGYDWEPVYRLDEKAYIRGTLFISPYDGTTMLAPVAEGDHEGDPRYYLRSTDQGCTWRRREYAPGTLTGVNFIGWDIVQLRPPKRLPYQKTPGVLFMSGEYGVPKPPDYVPALLRSRNNGLTWENIAENLGPDPWHAAVMAVSNDGHRVYHQGEGAETWWSDDAGETWAVRGNSMTHIATEPLSDALIFSKHGPTTSPLMGGVWVCKNPSADNYPEEFHRVGVAVSSGGLIIGDKGRWLWVRSYDEGVWRVKIPRL